MKNQLTELLTNYGEIGGIWFDGYWDQLRDDSDKNQTPKVDWHLKEIYALIHQLQPQCLIGNNHHLQPLPGEDFQMFEKDLPGGNTTGFGGASVSALPLETCETIIIPGVLTSPILLIKTHKQLIDYLVKAAGYAANFLLNIGPMPNGKIQPEFLERLHFMGNWLQTYGESIYGTKGGFIRPQSWGRITQKNDLLFVHVLDKNTTTISLENFPLRQITKAYLLKDRTPINYQLRNGTGQIKTVAWNENEPDEVIVLEVK